jgi:predicted component of type VI protein secretion system
MALTLEVISEHKRMLRDRFECSFGPDGGTIGRSLQNDWVLPDTELFISGRHATIDCRGGSYFLADISSNGVYINHSLRPLGHGNPRRLFDGDHLRMGNFEMIVHLDEGEDLDVPPESKPSIAPDEVALLVPEDDMDTSVMLLDEDEITGESAFSDVFFSAGTDPDDEQTASDASPANDAGARDPVERDSGPTSGTELLETFLDAAGVDPNDIHPSVDPREIMTNAGRVMAELVGGIIELLVARANMKSMFRLDQTIVLPRHNNPLKLSTSTADSLHQLLVGREGEYLGPLDSVREALKDLRWHHDAVVSAMIRSFADFVEQLDPERLEKDFEETLEKKPLFGSLGKRKYWDLYRDQYRVITEAGSALLPVQYSEDFVRQYEKQLKDYKRVERALGDTQKHVISPANRNRPVDGATRNQTQVDPGASPGEEEALYETGAGDGAEPRAGQA